MTCSEGQMLSYDCNECEVYIKMYNKSGKESKVKCKSIE